MLTSSLLQFLFTSRRVFLSGISSNTYLSVKPRNADQQMASEVLLFHYEDISLPREIVKLAVRAGMWSLVKKLHLGVQIYRMEKENDESPSRITTKLPASPSTIMFHNPEAHADENVSQRQNPETQARESS